MKRAPRDTRLCSPRRAASLVTVAGASDSRTYQVELFNAFGLVKGSELRVAGAKAGTITDLDITPQKTALVTFEEDSSFPEFKADASCSSEPQSLIAEYFLNCQPGTSTQPLNGPIPAARNKTTVQPDLAQNTLREPFRDRLQLLINEFGTALDGNAENLNAAIRAGAPALQQLKQVLNILGNQNRTIAELNTNADAIFAAARQPPRGRRPLHRQRRPHRGDLGRALERPGAELPPARRLPLPS